MIVFDLDGTLADCRHRLHHIKKSPKDWDAFFQACEDDPQIKPTVTLCTDLLYARPGGVEFWTGRPERIRGLTSKWLWRNLGPKAERAPLRMRADGDYRPDWQVKLEYLDPDNPPEAIFEDRARVVRAFRAEGYIVYHVADGDF